ncbi:unnamed protein product [Symbiodinium natans]|uniref:Uncharacterized protein n=1 Tax=Symbiodinium natans TaxID=878477 RepID=A0A812J7Q4_9DINO|nr:unnamed protein product [Symbiodinium natans]
MAFQQFKTFQPGASTEELFSYDKHKGRWCLSGVSCASSDAVHPLDASLGNHQWRVVAVSDFDAVFEARGAKPNAARLAGAKPEPPTLIKFGAEDPEYAEECKDESHPGSADFNRNKMNEVAEGLDDENPCKYVYGKPPKDKDLKEVEGMGFWKAIKGEPSQPGVSYKDVKECADEEGERELNLAKNAKLFFNKMKAIPGAFRLAAKISAAVPDMVAAPFGAGIQTKVGEITKTIGNVAEQIKATKIKVDKMTKKNKAAEEKKNSCQPAELGFARVFCDLHCIRDSVRKGDNAILRAIEGAVDVVGQNTQLLLEHYVARLSFSIMFSP